MGKTEVQAAVTALIAQGRAADRAGVTGLGVLIGALSTATSTFASVTENTISQAQIDTISTALTNASTGRGQVQAALDDWLHALENNNAGLRNE